MAKAKLHKTPEGECLFCGAPGGIDGSKEDVIPLWLVDALGEAVTLTLPNGVIQRNHRVVVPACKSCNGTFSVIEQRIREQKFTPLEAWVWAFKVHAGLGYRNLRQRNKPSDPNSVSMNNRFRSLISEHLAQFRECVKVWNAGGQFNPLPPGSVLVLKSLIPDMVDFVQSPYGFVGVNLWGTYLGVALFDGGYMKRMGYEKHFTIAEMHKALPGTAKGNARERRIHRLRYQRYWLARIMQQCRRAQIRSTFSFDKGEVRSETKHVWPPLPHDDAVWAECMHHLGVTPWRA